MTAPSAAFYAFSRRTLEVTLPAILVLTAACASDSSGPDKMKVDVEPLALAGITAAHNEVRAKVGVGPLKWSAALAATAQAWVDQGVDVDGVPGIIDINTNRSAGHPYYVGENIYASTSPATPSAAVALWASEGARYDYASNTCSSGYCGNYTQVVWAATREVGCGIAWLPHLTFSGTIVCNYGPGGNIVGSRPY